MIARKVTNGFRSIWGAEPDAAVRSVVDTNALARYWPLKRNPCGHCRLFALR